MTWKCSWQATLLRQSGRCDRHGWTVSLLQIDGTVQRQAVGILSLQTGMTLVSFSFFSLALLVLLSRMVRQGRTDRVDEDILSFFRRKRTPAADWAMGAVTWCGSMKLLGPAAATGALVLIMAGQRRHAVVYLLGILGCVGVVYAMKFSFARPRPSGGMPARELPRDPSYPSAHTAQSFSFSIMGLLLADFPGIRAFPFLFPGVLFSLSAMVALSRIYLQVHYPSDVMAGLLVASGWCATVLLMFN